MSADLLTVSSRILECDKPGGSGGRINVEIWDVSGNQKCVLFLQSIYIIHHPSYTAALTCTPFSYEACWPAIMKDVRGVILVYNPDVPSHEPEVGIWFDHFVKGAHLQPDCVLGIVHRSKDASRSTRTRPPPNLGDINMVSTAWGNSTSSIASAFDEFIVNVSSMRK